MLFKPKDYYKCLGWTVFYVIIQVLGEKRDTDVFLCLYTGVSLCICVFVKRRQEVAQLWLLFHKQQCAICDSHCMHVLFFLGSWSAPVGLHYWFPHTLVCLDKVCDTKQKHRLRKGPVTTKKAPFHMKRGLRFLYDKVCEDISAHRHTLQIYVQTRRICVSGKMADSLHWLR